jgi:hypothetical protein
VRRRLATVTATVLAACGAGAAVMAAPAAAHSSYLFAVGGGAKTVSVTQLPARLEGLLTVEFHGDRAAGCAARGLCGYSGTVVWQPPRTGSLGIVTYREGRKIEHQASLDLTGFNAPAPFSPRGGVATADVRSQPTGPGAPSSACTDAAPTAATVDLPLRGHAVLFALARATPGLTRTRCAAPLAGDIAHAVGPASVSLRRLLRGNTGISLASSGAFAGGGFAGTVSSTVRLSLGRPTTQPEPSGRVRGPTVRFRSVDVRYRATIAGRVLGSLRGDPRSCSLLGSCGADGSFELRPGAMRGVLDITAVTRARRPLRDVLTALGLRTGGNARAIATFGSVILSGPGTFDAAFTEGAVSCHDSVASGTVAFALQIAGGSVSATYSPSPDGLHTRCPGPLIDSSTALATGSAPLSLLGRRTAAIPLGAGSTLLDDGYDGRTVSNLRLTITRTRIRTTFQNVPTG